MRLVHAVSVGGLALLGLLPCFALGCEAQVESDAKASEPEATGAVRLELQAAPADALCLQVSVVGTRTVQRSFGLTPGAATSYLLQGLPLGAATFTAKAFNAACDSVTTSSVATWVTEPVSANVTNATPAVVNLLMLRNGRGAVAVDWEPTDGGAAPDTSTINPTVVEGISPRTVQIPSGGTAVLTLRIAAAAPAGGSTWWVSVNPANAIAAPTAVTVPAGSNSASFNVTATQPTSAESVVVVSQGSTSYQAFVYVTN